MPLPQPAVGKEMGNFYFQFELMGTKPGRAGRALLPEQTVSVGEEAGTEGCQVCSETALQAACCLTRC